MYLSRKQTKALELALEAMESSPTASYNDDQNKAMQTIVEMLDSARKERDRRAAKRRRKKLWRQEMDKIAQGFDVQEWIRSGRFGHV